MRGKSNSKKVDPLKSGGDVSKRDIDKIALLKLDNLEKGSARMVNEVVLKRDFDNLK